VDGQTTAVAAVIVNYQRYDLLQRCLVAISVSTLPPAEIVVVDNASSRPESSVVDGFPGVRVIPNVSNDGYARACNQGWRATTSPFLLFLNPDVTVERETIRATVDAAESDAAIGIVTPRLMRPDGRMDHACHRGFPTPATSLAYVLRLNRVAPRSRRLAAYTMSWLDPTTDHDVDACCGAFMLVRREVLEALGGWDEGYRFYAEDLDLCLRANRRGWRVRFIGTATATHLKGASSRLHDRGPTTRGERMRRRDLRATIIDSHERFYEQHYERSTSVPLRLAIRSAFVLQRLRLTAASWLDRRRAD
jgi:GT2 family glycosyltransferase